MIGSRNCVRFEITSFKDADSRGSILVCYLHVIEEENASLDAIFLIAPGFVSQSIAFAV